ncbi:uroporphyrin-III C-methyltransferase/precorrin-2 dehydrogenase/sirohydrochlorin ferrochelatase [Nocardia fluminea]|uniref:uroporphyrinogen-III C-methyltransferase n=1 Tax=Nocardia fluminea TaxID=134984 RepID=A0A2N3VG90_9NOCA|nr:uroporphyrin-III C-methyltransferase/precorrin-2 dehydrogenase/sirohydrochlorin ferrochelatase [Nocardia fluminea]
MLAAERVGNAGHAATRLDEQIPTDGGCVRAAPSQELGWDTVPNTADTASTPPAGDPNYLVGLDLRGRRVVVVGGGTVAQRRLGLLVASGADVHVISRAVTPAVEGMATAGQIAVELRAYADGDLDGAWYAMACTDEPDTNAAVVAEATAKRIFCVRADIARDGTAVTPATARYDGLSLGVLAGGEHRRSAAVRNGLLEALQSGVVTDDSEPVTPGVALVGGGPGDPDLITVRGRRLLARADLVVADRLAPPELLAELGPHVEVIDAAKIPYGRSMAQEAINLALVEGFKAGKFVVRLKGGDPYVFGRGYEELEACTEAGIPVTVVPGVTSPISVPGAAGIPVTHRGVTHEFVVVSGHVAPDHPDSLVDWSALAKLRGTIVLMMAVERIDKFAAALLAGGRPSDTPAAVIQEGTLRTQRVVRADLATVADRVKEEGIRPPAIIVIGPTAGFGLD